MVALTAVGRRRSRKHDAWEALGHAASPLEDRPRLVDGVEASELNTRHGEQYVVIRNPAAGTYLRLDPREHAMLPLMDGTRTVKDLVVEYYQRHGVLALPRIAALVRSLREARFLTEPPIDAYAAIATYLRARDAGMLLARLARGFVQTELSVRGMDARLAGWYRAWGHLFFGWFWLWLGIGLGLLGPALFLLEAERGRYQLFQAGGSYLLGLALFLGLNVAAIFVHEMGHAMAMKRVGRHVNRAGVLLYYGMPGAFVDTTDVWMAPARQRMLVSFAGPWTGLVLCGLCAIGAYLLPTGPVGAFLFAWGFVFLINTVLQFCPLLELDGYFLLVDWLEMPMLRARSFAFVRGPLWRKLRRRERLSGEERVLAVFGLPAGAFTLAELVGGLRVWETRLGQVVGEVWASGSPFARVGLVVVLLAIGGPVLLGLWGAARRLAGHAPVVALRLAGAASARWHHDALEAIRAVPLWAHLPEGRLLGLARAMASESFAAVQPVVRQGDVGDRFCVVAAGAFGVEVDGRLVRRLGRGDYFGEGALLGDGRRTATVAAVEPGRVYSLGRAAFVELVAHDVATAARLEQSMAYRADVAAMPLFRDLSPAELDLLLAKLRPVTAAPGEPIVREGEPGDRFYVVRSGRVEVVKGGQPLAALGPGEAFGEIALLLDVPRTATVRATEPTELLALDAADFRDMLAGYLHRSTDLARLSRARLKSDRERRAALAIVGA